MEGGWGIYGTYPASLTNLVVRRRGGKLQVGGVVIGSSGADGGRYGIGNMLDKLHKR